MKRCTNKECSFNYCDGFFKSKEICEACDGTPYPRVKRVSPEHAVTSTRTTNFALHYGISNENY
jgi:hypothetical protein